MSGDPHSNPPDPDAAGTDPRSDEALPEAPAETVVAPTPESAASIDADETVADAGTTEDGTGGPTPAPSLDVLRSEVKRLMAERSYGEAAQTCRRLLLQNPALSDVRVLLGMSLLALERYEEARAEMRAVLQNDPQHATAHRILAEGFLRAGQPAEARKILRRTLDLAPEDNDAKALLSEAIEEEPPEKGTVDRWFDPRNLATQKSSLPPIRPEEETSPSTPSPPSKPSRQTDMEVVDCDPSLLSEVDPASNPVVDELVPTHDSDEPMSTVASHLQQLAEGGLEPLPGEATVSKATEIWGLGEEDSGQRDDETGRPIDEMATAASITSLPPPLPRPRAKGRRSFPWQAKAAVFAVVLLAGAFGVGLAVLAVKTMLPPPASLQVRERLEDACEKGDVLALREASELADSLGEDGESVALRARILAMATFEDRMPHRGVVRRLIRSLSESDRALPDARVAEAYLALAEGDLKRAARATSEGGDGERAPLETEELVFLRALTALRRGEPDRARSSAEQLARVSPSSPRRTAPWVIALSRLGEHAAALKQISAAPATAGGLWSAAQADALYRAGKRREGMSVANQIIGAKAPAGPSLARAYLLRAEHQVRLGSFERARSDARHALAGQPYADEHFLLRLGEVFLRAGDTGGAELAFSQLPKTVASPARRTRFEAELRVETGRFEEAAAVLNGMPSDAPDPGLALLRGRVAEARGEAEAAEAHYRHAASSRDHRLQATLGLVRLAVQGARFEEAAALLEPAYEANPDHPAVVQLFVDTLLAVGSPDRAAELLKNALSLSPEAPALAISQARILTAAGKYREAADVWQALTRENPRSPDHLRAQGLAAERAGDASLAAESYQALAALNPNDPQGPMGLFRTRLMEADLLAAADALQSGTSIQQEDRDWMEAALAVAQGEGARALPALEHLVTQHNLPVAHLLLGEAALQAERASAAAEAFSVAADGPPSVRAQALLGLAHLALRAGKTSEAQARIKAAGETMAQLPPEGTRVWLFPVPGVVLRAHRLALEGMLAFEKGLFQVAEDKGKAALALDGNCSNAHLLLAELALEGGQSALPHYQQAASGRFPPAEAVAQAALRRRFDTHACSLAKSYQQRAPEGIDAAAIGRLVSRCP